MFMRINVMVVAVAVAVAVAAVQVVSSQTVYSTIMDPTIMDHGGI